MQGMSLSLTRRKDTRLLPVSTSGELPISGAPTPLFWPAALPYPAWRVRQANITLTCDGSGLYPTVPQAQRGVYTEKRPVGDCCPGFGCSLRTRKRVTSGHTATFCRGQRWHVACPCSYNYSENAPAHHRSRRIRRAALHAPSQPPPPSLTSLFCYRQVLQCSLVPLCRSAEPPTGSGAPAGKGITHTRETPSCRPVSVILTKSMHR